MTLLTASECSYISITTSMPVRSSNSPLSASIASSGGSASPIARIVTPS